MMASRNFLRDIVNHGSMLYRPMDCTLNFCCDTPNHKRLNNWGRDRLGRHDGLNISYNTVHINKISLFTEQPSLFVNRDEV